MPKVETSLILTRGNCSSDLQLFPSKYVSNLIGTDTKTNYAMSRRKREATTPKHMRVVKKLVRVEPVRKNFQSIDVAQNIEASEKAVKRVRPRKRLLIKKKKRKILSSPTKPSRRTVVITKKRLITNTNEVLKTALPEITESYPMEDFRTSTPDSDELTTTSGEADEENEITTTPFALEETEEPITEEEQTDPPTTTNPVLTENILEDDEDTTTEIYQNVPDYEPSFPELSLDAPILILKTTVLSSVELQTKTVVQSRLRTYTFLITRVNGDEQIVTSTTEVKPHTKTIVVTEPFTRYTTLTLLNLDPTETQPLLPITENPVDPSSQIRDEGRGYEEARYNLATRVMSNGVEVIVAGDKSTLPGEPDVLRVLPSSIYKPVTLKPSTLSDHMMLMVPEGSSEIQSIPSLYPNEFVTKTCLTTFTYLTTYLENGTTAVSSHEQVVSNIATEERNTAKILPTPSMGITLTQHPNLAMGLFVTTYTYLNTIMDGEQPLVITSKHTVTNTVTAPDDYLSLLKPSEKASAVKDTNTYYSTIALQKTLEEGGETKVVSTNEVVTQVVITESVPPKASSVMTAYVALDVEDPPSNAMALSTTDVVKTYFVTYTYYNTVNENGRPVVKTNISTSSDIVTEKLFLHPKRTVMPPKNSIIHTSPIDADEENKDAIKPGRGDLKIFAEKTYLTTFTYFTTLLQEKEKKTSTISHTRVVQDVVTETLQPSLLQKDFLNSLKVELQESGGPITKIAVLQDGKQVEITAVNNLDKVSIQPTKVLPIEKTKSPELNTDNLPPSSEFSKPNIITGSTIIFFDDLPQEADSIGATPSLAPKPSSLTKTPIKNNLNSLLSSEIVKKTTRNKITATTKPKQSSKLTKKQTIAASKPVTPAATTNKLNSEATDKKKPATKLGKPPAQVPDLLGLGSININSLQALTPVLNAMAGLIQTNLNPKHNDSTEKPPQKVVVTEERKPAAAGGGSHPIYIPVGEVADDFETAESQNVAHVFLNNPSWDLKNKKPVESPLLNGGIPISPGEVITATSDVIVGKPGRVGPRKPTIPLIAESASEDVPIGMKPPPPPNKNWPKRHLAGPSKHNNLSKHEKTPIIHAPNKDDYVGPPPNPPRPVRGEKHKHIPLSPPRLQHQHVYAKDQTGYLSFGQPLQLQPPVVNLPNLQDEIQKNYEAALQNNYPMYAPQPPAVVYASPTVDFSIQPSIINEPIVLPEVIERSTGQPLMVNIQPSQVAFVNIPYNRTTALIFGGSTEPHKNGQYFDEPSPYPEPELASINQFNNRVHMSPIYPGIHNGQKEVGGVIKVGPQFVNAHSDVVSEGGSNFHVQIRPTKPLNKNDVMISSDVNVNLPPISFEMVQQGNDFNAHIINHDDIRFQAPPFSYKVVNSSAPAMPFKRPTPPARPTKPARPQRPKPVSNKPVPLDYLTPPLPPSPMRPTVAFTSSTTTSKPRTRRTRPTTKPTTPVKDLQNINNVFAPNNQAPQDSDKFSDFVDSDLSAEQDSYENEAGEVLQGSNRRPLRPGEVPIEILRSRTTTPRPTYYKERNDSRSQVTTSLRPVLSNPRPFEKGPIVRPENVQTNQVNPNDNPIYISYRPDPQYAPAYISNGTYSGKPTIISGIYHTTPRPKLHKSTVSDATTNRRPSRPLVTSLPIDSFLEHNLYENVAVYGSGGSQTEKPFGANIKTTTTQATLPDLNIGEIPMPHQINDFISDLNASAAEMEVLKPPPPVMVEEPAVEMQPPKLIVTAPTTQKPAVELEAPPPPKAVTVEEVVGMSPPPSAAATVSTATSSKNPGFSLQIDAPKYKPKVGSTTEGYDRFTRRRYPSTRRTTTTTAAPPSTSRPPFYRRPTLSVFNRRKSTTSTTPKSSDIVTVTSIIENTSKMVPHRKQENKRKQHTVAPPKEESSGTTIAPTSTVKDSTNEIVQHSEDVVRVVESSKERTPVLPTRYITHTVTSTVTITKTSVVTASGLPPSTITLLITKTETSTLVDTVTEFHTLLQPTSITETITTTVQQPALSLYPPDVPYGNANPIQPTPTVQETPTSTVDVSSEEENLEDFIITDSDAAPTQQMAHPEDNESIFVVMTDKNQGSVIKMNNKEAEPESYEIENRDEMVPNGEANNVLLGGVLIASPPSLESNEVVPTVFTEKCTPECKATKNELCQKAEGVMRCVCRPGFARMFPDRPCKPTYTYSVTVGLETHGKQQLRFEEDLKNSESTRYARLAAATHDALDRMVMQSDLRDIYHGVHINEFKPAPDGNGVLNNFYLQLSDSTDEKRLEDVFKKYLRGNNYSLGGTDLYASRDSSEGLVAEDFDECTSPQYHDCSEHAQCFNLKGTYTCSCKEGFADLSENVLYPGRICSAELIGCDKCHYHGTCYSRGDDQVICECFQWYAGESCHINLKVLLIALVTLGTILLGLLFVCIILTCVKKNSGANSPMSFLPQRVQHGTIDRRAMIQDTSSESGQSDTNTLPYVAKQKAKPQQLRGALKKPTHRIVNTDVESGGENTLSLPDQKDRSLTVMIPRAKYHPAPPTPHMASFEKRKTSCASSNEAKLLSYLDAGPTPSKSNDKRKYSNTATNDSYINSSRKTSGALVSAGFEVSATVLANNMGTLGTIATTCGTEADRSENATLIQKISADLLSSTGTRSQFNTLRNSLVENKIDPIENWLDIPPRITTVSEARSYDETTIPPATKSFRNDYDSKPSSQHPNDEANTMAERDLGSTFLLPHTHLYKPDRGSDVSGFESL